MKKIFENPEIEVIILNADDIMTESGWESPPPSDNDGDIL